MATMRLEPRSQTLIITCMLRQILPEVRCGDKIRSLSNYDHHYTHFRRLLTLCVVQFHPKSTDDIVPILYTFCAFALYLNMHVYLFL